MKFIQKSFDMKVLLVVISIAGLLLVANFAYSRLSVSQDISLQSSAEASITPVIALDPSNSAGAVAIGDLLKICPDEEIINKMPTLTPSQNPPSIYFILDGKRRELSEFDLPWVSANCDVGEQAVY